MKKVAIICSFAADLTGWANHLPVIGETVLGTSFKAGPGGKGSNQAVAAKRAGAEVMIMAKVGNDVFGKMALDSFAGEGISTDFVFQDDDHATGAALIMVDSNTAANKILIVPGANSYLTPGELHKFESQIENASYLLVQLENNLEAVISAIGTAHGYGVPVILNPAPAAALDNSVYEKIEILTPNEIEAEMLSGIAVVTPADAERAAGFFLERGVTKVIITMGDKGAYAHDGKTDVFIPSFPVQAKDTTGAGDAFNGGFVAALNSGYDFFEAVRFANATAALSVTRIGTAPAMPYRDEILELYKREK